MQCERAPDVFGIRRGDGILLQFEPRGGYVLERMFRFRSFGFLEFITLSFGVNALCKQLSGLNGFLPGLRKRNLGIGAECHVDSVLGYWMPVVEIPLHRAIDPDSQLEPVAIGEDVILGRGFDSLELSIGEAEVLGRHEIVLRH